MDFDLFTRRGKVGVLLCFLKRNFAKNYILDEAPKSCLMSVRIYEDGFEEMDYKYERLDDLVCYGRLDVF